MNALFPSELSEIIRPQCESILSIYPFEKYLRAALDPAFWGALARGVMPSIEHISVIRGLRPRTLIDVGANKGQFSVVARRLFPDISIHAFEPIATERTKLSSVVKSDGLTIYPVAVGRCAETRAFYVTSRPDSSSLLKPASKQKEAFNISLVSVDSIEVVRLADVIKLRELQHPVLLKIDIQGGELDALVGVGDEIRHIDFIYCEVSFVELYEGQPLARDVISYLQAHGFSIDGFFNQAATKRFGPTQADVLFRRG